jgi:hypothetical protein
MKKTQGLDLDSQTYDTNRVKISLEVSYKLSRED